MRKDWTDSEKEAYVRGHEAVMRAVRRHLTALWEGSVSLDVGDHVVGFPPDHVVTHIDFENGIIRMAQPDTEQGDVL